MSSPSVSKATVSSESIVIKRIIEQREIDLALELERRIFDECQYVSMDQYNKYLPQSEFFGAFNQSRSCIGVVRLVRNGDHLPPFLEHNMEISDAKERWTQLAEEGQLWEFATMAVEGARRNAPVFLSLVRAAYRYAQAEGVGYFGAIMNPARADAQNRAYQMLYRRVGPNQHYMGEEEVTAPYVLAFAEQDRALSIENPPYYRWLLEDEPTTMLYRPPKKPDVIDLREWHVSENAVDSEPTLAPRLPGAGD